MPSCAGRSPEGIVPAVCLRSATGHRPNKQQGGQRYHEILQTQARDKERCTEAGKAVSGHYGIRCRCPVAGPGEPARVQVVHDHDTEPSAGRDRAGDVYREVRVPE